MSDLVKTPRRAPMQGRTQDRMARVLAAAEEMLVEVGPERLSIPDIAAVAGVPRSSIYQFYPDKYAVFASMADTQMTRLSAHLAQVMPAQQSSSWRAMIGRALEETAAFYNTDRLASLLLLKGPFGEQDRIAHHRKDRELAAMFRALIALDPTAPRLPTSPDVAAIGVEVAFSVLKYGYELDGALRPTTIDEAARAVCAYLADFD